MIDIIGHIKIDESKPERIKMCIASLRSLAFLKGHMQIVLNLSDASERVLTLVWHELKALGNNNFLFTLDRDCYGADYLQLMRFCQAPFIMNFIEDHFCVLQDKEIFLNGLLGEMNNWHVEICKASFFEIEQNSIKDVGMFYSGYGQSFCNNESNFKKYQQHYGQRYYIGLNFITRRDFAQRFWNRKLGRRPHEYEVPHYDENFLHACMVPSMPILESIDDDHGEPNTCLLKTNNEFFWKTYNGVKLE
jgi:hypothetical protein